MTRRILIIDDDHLLCDLACSTFSGAGYATESAANGAKGLAALRRERADLVLLDAAMPVLDGFETLAKIRADAALRDIPIVMLTAKRTTADVKRAMSLGITGYIAKPFDSRTLVARVERALAASAARSSEPAEDAWEL